ncbi:MAG: metallophosphatase family protein [Bacteroidetes bacterium SW_9_63_38]|nr:MAG: metallophosphatase family protein [Bacteroidetes bacterium SW_9_63_38]
MTTPGRTCPRRYRTQPDALAGAADVTAEIIYVVGGLYGNVAALAAVQTRAEQEREAGRPAPVFVFNGDFNWFNATTDAFRAINEAVFDHWTLQGNVEAELGAPTPGAGCGCAYPDSVSDERVDASNRIMERLQAVARQGPDWTDALADPPLQLTAEVGSACIGIIHSDPDRLAGWGLAVKQMPPPGTTPPNVARWFRAAEVDGFACTHTCLPHLQDFTVDGTRRLVVNNGAAGMPNFRGGRTGAITRISTQAAPFDVLYDTTLKDVHCEAVGVECTPADWLTWFEETWPPGPPAWTNYRNRLLDGPAHIRADAIRLQRDS